MVRKNVPLIQNECYHIYNRAIAGNLLFREERNYYFFLSKVDKYILPAAELLAFCLMPNHYHFILKLKSSDISNPLQRLAVSYVKSYNLVYNQHGHLFQGPFQRIHVIDSNYLIHLSRYIHLNPVKADLVEKAESWDFSSYQEYIGLRTPDIADPLPILNLISEGSLRSLQSKQKQYQEFVQEWAFDYMEFKIKK